MKYKILFILLVLFIGALLNSCCSVPKAAPELSATLGQRISAIEEAHINLLHEYFNTKRQAVDQFIEQIWIPKFAENTFSDSTIQYVWNLVIESGTAQDKLEFLSRLGPKLVSEIGSKRQELINELDKLERIIESELRSSYIEALTINSTITNYLVSAAEVSENWNRLYETLGITDKRFENAIDLVESATSELLTGTKKTEQLDNILSTEDSYKDKLEQAIQIFKDKKQ